MRLPLFCLTFLFIVSTASPSHAENNNETTFSRAQSLINTFQVMCTLELPNFEHIDAKATAMRIPLQADNKGALPGNAVTHNKVWAGSLTTGPFVLLLDEMSGQNGKATGCAIVGEAPDLEAFRTEAIKTMKLGVMQNPEMGSDGSRSFIWNNIYGNGTTLILRDFKPAGKPGVMLKLLSMVKNQ
jgi:hypothetical protein